MTKGRGVVRVSPLAYAMRSSGTAIFAPEHDISESLRLLGRVNGLSPIITDPDSAVLGHLQILRIERVLAPISLISVALQAASNWYSETVFGSPPACTAMTPLAVCAMPLIAKSRSHW